MSARSRSSKDIQAYAAERFADDTSEHELTVLHDDGLYRHLRCRKPGTRIFGFDIVTYPEYLVYSGDMGEFMFTRLEDMFQFFRSNPDRGSHRINPDYWSQKCAAGEWEEFSKEPILQYLRERATEWVDNNEPAHDVTTDEDFDAMRQQLGAKATDEQVEVAAERRAVARAEAERETSIKEVFETLEREVDTDSEYEFNRSIERLENIGSSIEPNPLGDCWEIPTKAYTFRFLWCLHAIVWAIEQYDKREA